MASFEKFYPLLEKVEGGYLSAAMAAKIGDSGGETYKGVSRNNNPTWAGWKIIDAYKAKYGIPKWNYKIKDPELDRLVKELAKVKYWDKVKGDLITNQSVANLIADFGFHSGPGTPAKILREYLKYDNGGTHFDTGLIGRINKANQKQLFEDLQTLRKAYIDKIKRYSLEVRDNLKERVDDFFFEEESVPV